jgi:hypothetical protein
MKNVLVGVVIIINLFLGTLSYHLLKKERTVRLLNQELSNDINIIISSQTTALKLTEDHPIIKNLEVTNSKGEKRWLSEIINHDNSILILLNLTDCRLCFDSLVRSFSNEQIKPQNNLKILFLSDHFSDFLYFKSSYKMGSVDFLWSSEQVFNNYYQLGQPMILRLDTFLNIKDVSYLHYKFPQIGLSYFN